MRVRADRAPRVSSDPVSVKTEIVLAHPPEKLWNDLMFYEQVPDPPPLLLRLLLPAPERAERCGSDVGDETRCVYKTGYLIKRLVEVDRERYCRFDVVEQALKMPGKIRLIGGSYTLRALSDGATRIQAETRYVSLRRPSWLWRPIEAAVCHAFHRHILAAIGRAGRTERGRSGAAASQPLRQNLAARNR
ncbi:MAG TPA: hypothetical protein VEG84_10210 [Thermoanaerobaculia bacterium]|nr:hypothetical protein [Thermoanaerobaculia bacterium]